MKDVSARVYRYVREYRKLSQQQLANKLQVNQSTVSKVEQGRHFPSAIVLSRLEQLMNTSMKKLVRLSRKVSQKDDSGNISLILF